VLDILVQSKRNTKAAVRFFRKLLTELKYVPRVVITDKLRSYGAGLVRSRLTRRGRWAFYTSLGW